MSSDSTDKAPSQTSLIDLSNDSDDEISLIDITKHEAPIIDITEDDDKHALEDELNESPDFEIVEGLREALTLEDDDESPIARTTLPWNYVTLETCMTPTGLELRPGFCVELLPQASIGQMYSDFLRIDTILQDVATDEIFIRGFRFRRTCRLEGMLETKLNEVYMCRRYNQKDPRSINEQSLESITQEDFICLRRLILTNQPFPNLNWRWDRHSYRDRKDVRERGQLVCRYAYTTVSNTLNPGKHKRFEECRLERLSENEADSESAMSDQVLRTKARMPPINPSPIDLTGEQAVSRYRKALKIITLGGQQSDELGDGPGAIDLNSLDEDLNQTAADTRRSSKPLKPTWSQNISTRHNPSKQYTYGDAFCGAGGMSSGARRTGLKLMWAFDHWKDACRSFKANFTGVHVFCKDAHQFITRWRENRMVDILHLSPPCQYLSPAHTIAGKDDEANVAAIFSIASLVQKARPRVVTLEETSGLQTHHPIFLFVVIQQLTRLGYSVRWKVMILSEYGLVQPRKRLFIIASCPGEPLPPFPEVTHGPDLKPLTTIRNVLDRVEVGMHNHDVDACIKRDYPAYDPDTQLRGCITTSGGDANLHPSGKRTFTCRELASLQSFPTDHVFLGSKSSVTRQIGNAVPPTIAQQVLEAVCATLRATDAAEAAREEEQEQGRHVVGTEGRRPEYPIVLD